MTLRIHTVRKGGRVYRYTRVPGLPRVRLPDLPLDDPEFLRAYAEAVTGRKAEPRARAGTLAAVIDALEIDGRLDQLAQDYRKAIVRELGEIRAQAEDAKAADLRPRHVSADLAPLKPHKANVRRKAWRILGAFGLERGAWREDPTNVPRKRIPKSEGWPTWTDAEIDRFRARWPVGSIVRLCFELLYWTAARISDAARLGDVHVDGKGLLAFRMRKTKAEAFVPWTSALPVYAEPFAADRALLFQCLAARPFVGPTYLATGAAKDRDAKGLGVTIGKAAREAGVRKSAHGLRKTRLTKLADEGATTHEIWSWSGHLTLEEVAHYTARAERRRGVLARERGENVGNRRAAV